MTWQELIGWRRCVVVANKKFKKVRKYILIASRLESRRFWSREDWGCLETWNYSSRAGVGLCDALLESGVWYALKMKWNGKHDIVAILEKLIINMGCAQSKVALRRHLIYANFGRV